jgi:hypothetical protein
MAKSPLAVKRKSTLSAYEPSLREKAAILGEKGFKAVMGREPGYEARDTINRYTGLLDLLDVPGMALSADDARRNIQSKQYGPAVADIAGLAVGAIPMVGGALKGGAKKAVKEGVEKLAAKYELPPVITGAEREANLARFLEGSQVVDAEGKPLTVYHGTGEDFSEFDTSGGTGKTKNTGSFFSSNPSTASTYAIGANKNVMPVHLNLQNPAIIDAMGSNWNMIGGKSSVKLPEIVTSDQADQDLLAELKGVIAPKNSTKKIKAKETTLQKIFSGEMDYPDDTVSTDDLARWARNSGYDGLIVHNVMDRGPSGMFATDEASAPSSIYVPFNKTQIKSKFNIGTFDPTVPHIGKAHGGPVSLSDKYGC